MEVIRAQGVPGLIARWNDGELVLDMDLIGTERDPRVRFVLMGPGPFGGESDSRQFRKEALSQALSNAICHPTDTTFLGHLGQKAESY